MNKIRNNNSLRAQKLRKLQELNAEGVQTYGRKFARTHTAAQVVESNNVRVRASDESSVPLGVLRSTEVLAVYAGSFAAGLQS